MCNCVQFKPFVNGTTPLNDYDAEFWKKCRFYKKKIETIPYTRQLRKDIQGLIIADILTYKPAFCSYFTDFILLSKTGIPL